MLVGLSHLLPLAQTGGSQPPSPTLPGSGLTPTASKPGYPSKVLAKSPPQLPSGKEFQPLSTYSFFFFFFPKQLSNKTTEMAQHQDTECFPSLYIGSDVAYSSCHTAGPTDLRVPKTCFQVSQQRYQLFVKRLLWK